MSERRSGTTAGGTRGMDLERRELLDVMSLAPGPRTRSDGGSRRTVPAQPEAAVHTPALSLPARTSPSLGELASELPNWFWGAVGLLSVLLVGFGAIAWLAHAGVIGGSAPTIAAKATPSSERSPSEPSARGQIQVEPILAAMPQHPEAAPVRAESRRAPLRGRWGVARGTGSRYARGGARGKAVAAAGAVGKPAEVAEDGQAADDGEEAAAEEAPHVAPAAAAVAAPPAPAAPTPAAAPSAGEPAARELSQAEAWAAPEDAPEEPVKVSGQREVVEAALTALAPRVRRCFIKFQIPGKANVTLVALPTGSAESITVAGEFEGTPTGECVTAELAEASLPNFKGSPVRLSHTYVLR